MMNKRFIIEKLEITGAGVKPAILSFTSGANLVIGSSDTGKSYIFQCLNYLLGAYPCPKDIPESKEYERAYLQLKTNDEKRYTISRELRSNSKAYVSETNIEKHDISKKEIGIKNNTLDGNNISEFLLGLMGIQNVLIKKNSNNKTQKLSYRDIARLTLIDEERIITEGSPVYTSKDGYTNFTVEKSAFKYLLTARDDKDLNEKEEKKVRESRITGKIELLERFIQSKNDSIVALQESLSTISSIQLQKKIEELISKIEDSSLKIEKLTKQRNSLYKTQQEKKSERLRTKELLDRFYLLRDHYNSDLNRLNFILDGEFLFSQLVVKDCPLCGTTMNEEHLNCLSNNVDVDSIKIEGRKIELKIQDLTSTIDNSKIEIESLNKNIDELEIGLKTVETSIESELIPLRQNFQKELQSLMHLKKTEQEILMRKDDITNFYSVKATLEAELQNKSITETDNVSVEYKILNSFCKTVEAILKEWKYPNLTTVEFDSEHRVFDITISGRKRNSHGKGVRALSYAAFTIGLLDFCISTEKPHPGVVVLDSPLTTYHQNKGQDQIEEKDDDASKSMQDAFFEYLSITPSNRQIIILDNKIPEADVIGKVNYISFLDEPDSIRKGFFPKLS